MATDVSLTNEESLSLRQAKLDRLRREQVAYPNNFHPTANLKEASEVALGETVQVAGRIESRRTAGKACFADIIDGTGSLQLYANKDAPDVLAWLCDLDFGDIVGIEGNLFKTKMGEITVDVSSGMLLSKCLQNYTPKIAPTEEQEQKRRYLAMAMKPELRERFRRRSGIMRELRRFFDGEGFLEVETPMLHPVQGGATARPFKTEFDALDRTFFLRIAPELYLKRLLVGGYEKVYEINRSFRNEGMSDEHNPEFTMLEFYAAYSRHEDLMDLTERLIRGLAVLDWRGDGKCAETGKYSWGGMEIDLVSDYSRMTIVEALREVNGWSDEQVEDISFLRDKASVFEGRKAELAVSVEKIDTLRLLLFEKTVEEKLVRPTFITDFPASASPLARRRDDDPSVAERFELFIGGREIANGFSELNDPEEQARVFREQARLAKEGDDEAMRYDEDYINALRYGMPPAAGEGIGIDRLAMLLLGCESIRDVIAFPQLRPEVSKGRA